MGVNKEETMSKMIKVTDEVGARVAAVAEENGTTLAGAVNLLVTQYGSSHALLEGQKVISAQLGELRRLVEETTIDRVDASHPRSTRSFQSLDPEEVRQFWLDGPHDDENHLAWVSKAAVSALEESDTFDIGKWYIKDEVVFWDNTPVFKLSEFLKWRER